MATFPALTPATRVVTPAQFQVQPHSSMNGIYGSTLLCGAARDQQIEVTFAALSTADKDLIVDHYDGQDSGFLAFDVPNSLLSGFTPGDYITGGFLWRYVGPPEVVDRPIGDTGSCTLVHDVSVSLISQVADLQFVAGVDLRIGVSFYAEPITTVAGTDLTLALTFTSGVAGTGAPGADLSLALSLTSGAPTVTPPGADLTITVSFAAGAATTP